MDIVIAHFLPTCVIKTITLSSNKVNSCCDDYIIDYPNEYDLILLNPAWRVYPKVLFLSDISPVVITCRNHSGGTLK